jgi:hypothetical protein
MFMLRPKDHVATEYQAISMAAYEQRQLHAT